LTCLDSKARCNTSRNVCCARPGGDGRGEAVAVAAVAVETAEIWVNVVQSSGKGAVAQCCTTLLFVIDATLE
jgi:hypothetical protein